MRKNTVASAALLGVGLALLSLPPAFAGPPADWEGFLRRDAVEDMEISPDGRHLAVAERTEEGTIVSIRDANTLQALSTINPGKRGEVGKLEWLDSDRVLIAAARTNAIYNLPLTAPGLYIVHRDGSSKYRLPANFVATIDGEPDHLLVSSCHWDKGCVVRVHRAEIGHLKRLGDPIVTAPNADATLWPDQRGNIRFALAFDDEDQSKLWVHRDGEEPWSLVNDSASSGLHAWPLGIDLDGASAFIVSERPEGPDVVERFDIASGSRSEVYRHANSDPLRTIYSFNGIVPLGAYYGATRPQPVIWNPDHPDVPALLQILNTFPGKLVNVTSATNDGTLAVVEVASDVDPGSFYLFDLASKQASLLAQRKPWLDSLPLPETSQFRFTARDGVVIEGLLTRPADAGDQHLPMVVVPHGGPYGVFDAWGYDPEASLLAENGYAVLRVNFRGSGGRGRAFTEQGVRQWGRKMQDDVTDATRWAIDSGVADPSRVCIAGASYGGYAALMAPVRAPGVYRCAASFAGPTDLSKLYKWGSIRRSNLGRRYLERVLGTDKEELASLSPAQRVSEIGVPVLLGHGKLDARVDVKHARLIARSMRKAGLSPELVEYRNAGHSIARDEDRLDYYRRLLAFLATHLAGKPGATD